MTATLTPDEHADRIGDNRDGDLTVLGGCLLSIWSPYGMTLQLR
jgi:hypothetical protein